MCKFDKVNLCVTKIPEQTSVIGSPEPVVALVSADVLDTSCRSSCTVPKCGEAMSDCCCNVCEFIQPAICCPACVHSRPLATHPFNMCHTPTHVWVGVHTMVHFLHVNTRCPFTFLIILARFRSRMPTLTNLYLPTMSTLRARAHTWHVHIST
jgi:hypothetical protein